MGGVGGVGGVGGRGSERIIDVDALQGLTREKANIKKSYNYQTRATVPQEDDEGKVGKTMMLDSTRFCSNQQSNKQ